MSEKIPGGPERKGDQSQIKSLLMETKDHVTIEFEKNGKKWRDDGFEDIMTVETLDGTLLKISRLENIISPDESLQGMTPDIKFEGTKDGEPLSPEEAATLWEKYYDPTIPAKWCGPKEGEDDGEEEEKELE